MKVEEIARICHEVNRGLCIGLDDFSQVSWESAEDWQRESSLEGVAIALKGAEPHEAHESWAVKKLAEGWVYGEVKDTVMKTHPCLVTFGELPAEQRLKDHLFVTVVRVLGDVKEA